MAESRRSSRIAAQPKKEDAPKPARKPTKKRSTGETAGEDVPAAKKVCITLSSSRAVYPGAFVFVRIHEIAIQAKNEEKPTETKESEQPADTSVGDAKVEGADSQADNGEYSLVHVFFGC